MKRANCDFKVFYDPAKDSKEDLIKKILYSLFVGDINADKPVRLFIAGESGEGKTTCATRMMELLYQVQGLDMREYIDAVNIFSPLQYPPKMDKVLYDKVYKKANIMIVHEARDLIRASKFQSLFAEIVGDVNAQSRAIKCLMVIWVSQYIKDITKEMRNSMTHYGEVTRARHDKAKLRLYRFYKDTRDVERPVLRRRGLVGYIIYPDGKHVRLYPKYFIMNKPSKDIQDEVQRLDREAKAPLIRNKLEKMLKEIESEYDVKNNKVEKMLEWYCASPEKLAELGKMKGKKYKLNKDIMQMHDLTQTEAKHFERLLSERFRKVPQETKEGSKDATRDIDETKEE